MKKKIHITDQNVSSYNINLKMVFLIGLIKTCISKSGDGVFTTLCLTTVFTYSHATTPLGQSERAYYLNYFVMVYTGGKLALYIALYSEICSNVSALRPTFAIT